MDRAIIALWRGADLSTLSKNNATGASIQSSETHLIEEDDAALISETLHTQLDRIVINYLFGSEPKAFFHLKPNTFTQRAQELAVYEKLIQIGI